jgi:hypothetical protein
MAQTMLTTVDNPWSPFTHWQDWYQWDMDHGYATPSLLARIAITSDELSVADQQDALVAAMNEIVSENVLGIYKLVSS